MQTLDCKAGRPSQSPKACSGPGRSCEALRNAGSAMRIIPTCGQGLRSQRRKRLGAGRQAICQPLHSLHHFSGTAAGEPAQELASAAYMSGRKLPPHDLKLLPHAAQRLWKAPRLRLQAGALCRELWPGLPKPNRPLLLKALVPSLKPTL